MRYLKVQEVECRGNNTLLNGATTPFYEHCLFKCTSIILNSEKLKSLLPYLSPQL